MHVTDFALDDYRSYKHAVVQLKTGINVFLGANGQGKTNLVEALAYLSTFTSHRVGAATALVRLGNPGEKVAGAAVIRARAVEGERDRLLELEIVRGKANRARLNRGKVVPREILGIVKTVVFAPEDLQIVKGEPGGRRRFLDRILVQLQPVLAGVMAEHEKLLRQRAAVLKMGRATDLTTLDVWDQHLARAASRIICARARLIDQLRPLLSGAYQSVAPESAPAFIAYESSLDKYFPPPRPADTAVAYDRADLYDEDETYKKLTRTLRAVRSEELIRGRNLVGAHRDEMGIYLGQMPVRGYASHGETWSCALALRLAEFAYLKEEIGEPILILDDVFAELDADRRGALAKVITACEQVVITAAVTDDLPPLNEVTIFTVTKTEGGTVINHD
ncbi:MAG: DNA replication/repair protein RecF [Actinomycetaceae bacterium]|nr:DNA replication/repair protein RecF [Actinomycetaceae bacterium]